MYVNSAPKSGGHLIENSITVNHTAAGWTTVYDNDDFTTAKGRLSLGDPGYFYKKKTINVTAQNVFYNGGSQVTYVGTITVGTSSGTSPHSAYLNWTGSQTATATDNQAYPTGYRQIFNADVGWKLGGSGQGTTLQIPIQVVADQGAYQANFYQAVGVTFTPSGGGGGITVDGQTQYSSFTKYAKINPTPAEQVSATAVNTNSNRTDYLFANWTNSGNSNVDYTSSISFYPTAAITYTANFTAKPRQAENCYAGGVVGNPVQITWTQHPNANVTYKIYRRVKPLGGSTGSETLIASLSNATTSYTDYDYTVTSTYSDDLLSYDVRSYLNGVYSDPNFVQVFGRMSPRQVQEGGLVSALGELPTEYKISNFPNPFNPSTTISYQLVEDANVTLEIYDVMGRKINSLVQEQKQAGYHTAKWEGNDNSGKQVATGIYLYRFTASPTSGKQPFTKSGKLLLTK